MCMKIILIFSIMSVMCIAVTKSKCCRSFFPSPRVPFSCLPIPCLHHMEGRGHHFSAGILALLSPRSIYSLVTYLSSYITVTGGQNQVQFLALRLSWLNTDDRWGCLALSRVDVVGTSSDPVLFMGSCQEPYRQGNRIPIDGPNIVFLDRSMQSRQKYPTGWVWPVNQFFCLLAIAQKW